MEEIYIFPFTEYQIFLLSDFIDEYIRFAWQGFGGKGAEVSFVTYKKLTLCLTETVLAGYKRDP